MPRVLTFSVSIRTGERGTSTPIRCCINGHTVELEDGSGGTAPHETFTGSMRVMSFIHTLNLVGPDEGAWDVDGIEVRYECADIEPYVARFGEVTLDETTEVNIWAEDKPNIFYV